MAVLFVFVDGIGLGPAGAQNPLSNRRWSGLEQLSGGQPWTSDMQPVSTGTTVFKALDTTLGFEGLPQSGTGQVTLFTGHNAVEAAGRHFGPFPHSQTKALLESRSFFRRLLDAGRSPFFINAYPARFFEHGEKTGRWSTSSLMVRQCGIPLNSVPEVLAQTAVTAELFQDYWQHQLHLPVPDAGAADIAGRLSSALRRHDLVYLEYYLTDKAGHEQEQGFAEEALRRIDAMLAAWLSVREAGDTLVLTSDHGNVEDLSVKTHTMNPVPLAVFGPAAPLFADAVSLMDVCEPLVKAAGG